MIPTDYMFAKLDNFKADISKLKQHFLDNVTQVDPILYKDNEVKYFGWSVLSRDGGLTDGVKRISTKGPGMRGVTPTKICTGYLLEVIEDLKSRGLGPYRARMMQLDTEGAAMPFHVDATKETWRLHIPVITNEDSKFEWRREDGTIESVHLPADGSAWLVRVDVQHRAINTGKGEQSRVHLLMGCGNGVKEGMITEPTIRI